MTTCPRDVGDFNPLAADQALRLPEIVSELESAPPAFLLEKLGIWVIADPNLAQDIVRDPTTCVRFRDQLVMQRGEAALDEPFNKAWSKVVLNLDGADHRRVRRSFLKHFTPKRVEEMRPGMVELAEGLLSDIKQDGNADLVRQFLLPLVHQTISLLIGVEDDDDANLLQWTQAIHQNEQASAQVDEEGIANGRAAHEALNTFFSTLVSLRRKNPGNDLLSAMIAECDDGSISEEELIANTWALYLGGFDTTASVAAMSLVALQEQPDQLQKLLTQPSITGDMLEELVRVSLVALGSVRFLGKSFATGNVTVPEGSLAYLSWSTYNFGKDKWNDPFRIDFSREPSLNMTFSFGPHMCMGQWLARAAVGVSLETIYRNLVDVEVGPLEWAPNPSARLVRSLPAKWSVKA